MGYVGVVDRNLNVVIEPKYDDIDFEHLSIYSQANDYTIEEDYMIVEKNNRRAIIDYEDNIKIDFQEISYYDLNTQYKEYVKQSSNHLTTNIEITSIIIFDNEEKCFQGSFLNENGKTINLTISTKEFDLPDYLYEYRSNIKLRVEYSEIDCTVYDCKVINPKTGEVINDLSEDNLKKLFDTEIN